MSVCTTCHGGCCRRFNINLTGYDIIRISQDLGLDFKVFSQLTPVDSDQLEKYSKKLALFKVTDLDPDKYYRICLRLVNSRIFPDSLKCMFLQEWTNEDIPSIEPGKVVSRCGIYGSRSFACSIYPAELSQDGLIGLTADPNLYTEPIEGSSLYNLCPRPINEEDFADYSGNTMKNLVLLKYENDYFRSIAAIWNKEPRSAEDLYFFIRMSYRNRVLFQKPEE